MEKPQLTNPTFQMVSVLFYEHYCIFKTKVNFVEELCMAVHPVPISKRTANVFNFQLVTNEEVEKVIKSIKRSKATGIGDLLLGLIKDAASVISVPLSHI